MNNIGRGKYGEQLACRYLISKGYKILERNYDCYAGEIDIIASKDDYIVFVEVKARATNAFGTPSAAVDRTRQARYVRAAQAYLLPRGMQDCDCRFDVIEIYGEDKVEHITDAFRS